MTHPPPPQRHHLTLFSDKQKTQTHRASAVSPAKASVMWSSILHIFLIVRGSCLGRLRNGEEEEGA